MVDLLVDVPIRNARRCGGHSCQGGEDEALGDEGQKRRRLGQHAVFGGERRHAPFRVDGQKVCTLLLAGAEVELYQVEMGAGLVQRDMRGEAAAARRGIQSPARHVRAAVKGFAHHIIGAPRRIVANCSSGA